MATGTRKKPFSGFERADKFPSFMEFHSYSTKRVRSMSSPTGKTPQQLSKKKMSSVDPTLTKKKWTVEEREFLKKYVEAAGGVPRVGVNQFWERCSQKLQETCNTFRSGGMCRTQYKQVCCLFDDSSLNTATGATRIQQGTQTDITMPASRHRSYARFIPLLYEDQFRDIGESDTMRSMTESMRRCHCQPEVDVDANERECILNVVMDQESSINDIANVVLQQPKVKASIQRVLLMESHAQATSKCIRSKSSYLFSKTYPDLRDFSFEDLFLEFSSSQPFLLDHLLSVAVSTRSLLSDEAFFQNLVPKLSMIYGVLMSTRFPELSRFQKVMSSVLMDENAHEKVFDRLSVLGITTSFMTASRLVEEIGKHNHDEVVKKIKDGNTIRLVGDNINVKVGVKHERTDHHGTMYNWFASAIIIQSNPFSELPDQPQCRPIDLPLHAFLPTTEDYRLLKNDYTVHLCRVAQDFCPKLNFLFSKVKSFIPGEYTDTMQVRNMVTPLPVLPLNEQKYADVVQILDYYESSLADIYKSADMDVQQVQIGGDQLTRERFSGAKGLRTGCLNAEERYDNLYPITFEMWHTAMNFLRLVFKELFRDESFDKGTMNAAKIKLARKAVKKEVEHEYDHDKDFFLSFVRGYIVEALCDFFGMENQDDVPTQNLPPNDANSNEIEAWVQDTMGTFIDRYVFAVGTDASGSIVQEREIQVSTPLQVQLPDGSITTLNIIRKQKQRVQKTDHDSLKHYGHNVLNLGLLFMQFLDVCLVPDRQRMLSTFKYMMRIFKAKNNRSKYALEILRFLCHQQSTYSLKTAHQSFHGLFETLPARLMAISQQICRWSTLFASLKSCSSTLAHKTLKEQFRKNLRQFQDCIIYVLSMIWQVES